LAKHYKQTTKSEQHNRITQQEVSSTRKGCKLQLSQLLHFPWTNWQKDKLNSERKGYKLENVNYISQTFRWIVLYVGSYWISQSSL